jgi:hypothetical protein
MIRLASSSGFRRRCETRNGWRSRAVRRKDGTMMTSRITSYRFDYPGNRPTSNLLTVKEVEQQTPVHLRLVCSLPSPWYATDMTAIWQMSKPVQCIPPAGSQSVAILFFFGSLQAGSRKSRRETHGSVSFHSLSLRSRRRNLSERSALLPRSNARIGRCRNGSE